MASSHESVNEYRAIFSPSLGAPLCTRGTNFKDTEGSPLANDAREEHKKQQALCSTSGPDEAEISIAMERRRGRSEEWMVSVTVEGGEARRL